MGSGLCKDEKIHDEREEENKKRNEIIEAEIRKERIEERKKIKILLLGASDSGKSTIAKQMRILHTEGFNETEIINYRFMIYSNLIVSYHFVACGIYQLGINVPKDEGELIEKFFSHHFTMMEIDDDDQMVFLLEVKNYKSVAALWMRRTEVYLPDNTVYFLSDLDRILTPEFRPNVQDVLHARSSTTGVHEIMFSFKNYSIRLIDVGGQKTERRKWIHCFDNVTAILFVIGLSCYDQYMFEDPKKNCMEDSVELFYTMFNNQFLLKCSFILFLNKKDLFEEKLKFSDVKKYFPSYTGENEYEQASTFFKNLFMKNEDERRQIYPHFTNAVDTKNIEYVFGAACDIILQNNLTRAGMT